jgi:hypothetical protein
MLLAASDPQAGPIGLAVIVVLGIAVALLYRSMSGHLRKLPASFDKKPDDEAKPEDKQDQPPR